MKRSLVLACLILCLLIPSSTGADQHSSSWEADLKNGYISTKPIIVEDQVIVRHQGSGREKTALISTLLIFTLAKRIGVSKMNNPRITT